MRALRGLLLMEVVPLRNEAIFVLCLPYVRLVILTVIGRNGSVNSICYASYYMSHCVLYFAFCTFIMRYEFRKIVLFDYFTIY